MAAITATTALLAGGLALSGAGVATSYFGNKAAAEAQKDIIAGERRVEEQRMKAMELDARRKRVEQFRNQQRASAMAMMNANNQGAILGSGIQGGLAQISGATGSNVLGIDQNLEIGRNIFDINSQISNSKIAMADAQSTVALGQGLTSFGGSMMSSLGAFGKLSGGFPQGFPGFPTSGNRSYTGWA